MKKKKRPTAPGQEPERPSAMALLMEIMAQQEKTDPALLAKQHRLLEILMKGRTE